MRDPVREEGAIGQSGDGVMECLVRESRLERGSLARVAAVEHDAANVLVVAEVGRDHLELQQVAVEVHERAVERLRAGRVLTGRHEQPPQARAITGHEQVLEARAHDVVRAEAENALDRRALIDDLAAALDHGDEIARVLDERGEVGLVLLPMGAIRECGTLERERDARTECIQRRDEDRRERRRRGHDQQAALILARGEPEDVGVPEAGPEQDVAQNGRRQLGRRARGLSRLRQQDDRGERQQLLSSRHEEQALGPLHAQPHIADALDQQLRRLQCHRGDLVRRRRLDEREIRMPERSLTHDRSLVLPDEAERPARSRAGRSTIEAPTITIRS